MREGREAMNMTRTYYFYFDDVTMHYLIRARAARLFTRRRNTRTYILVMWLGLDRRVSVPKTKNEKKREDDRTLEVRVEYKEEKLVEAKTN